MKVKLKCDLFYLQTEIVFDGQYGSEVEQETEKDLDWLLEQKHHVDQAHFRWKQAQSLVNEASTFVGKAITKWSEIPKIPCENVEKRYITAAETRNLLVSASQNIYAALRYLPNIDVPYCNADEVEILDKAISYIFTDMATPERFQHALGCYTTTLKRIAALRQWLTQVISSTIARDLLEVQESCKMKATELRTERIRLIRLKIQEITGIPVDEMVNLNGTPSSDFRGMKIVIVFKIFLFSLFYFQVKENDD